MTLPDAAVTHRHVEVRGIRVHVVEAGDGPPLVLQHGFPQDWHCWEAVLPALARHHRVICPDMRGFGHTDAPPWGYDKEGLAQDLLAVTAALGVERFALAGHDWGGVAAFIAALRAPERVQRLVLLNTAHGFWDVDATFFLGLRGFWYMPLLATPLLGSALMRTRWFPRAVLRRVHPGLAWDEAAYETYLASIREQGARASASRRLYTTFVVSEFKEMARGRYKRERLTVPTLHLHGTADRAVRLRTLRGFEAYADDMRLEFLEGSGHFVVDDEPQIVADRILEFLSPPPAAAAPPAAVVAAG